jgi:hypothetical protein
MRWGWMGGYAYPVGEAVGGEVAHRVDGGVCLRWVFLLARSMDGWMVLVGRYRCFWLGEWCGVGVGLHMMVMARDFHLERSEWKLFFVLTASHDEMRTSMAVLHCRTLRVNVV